MPTTLATWRRYVASGGALRAGYPSNAPPPPPALTWSAPDTMVAGTTGTATIHNAGTVASGAWSLSQPSGLGVSPAAGGSIAAGATQTITLTPAAAGSYDLVLTCAGANVSGSPQTVVVSPVPVLAASYDAPAALTVNVAGSGSIQNTGNQPLVWSIAAPAHLTVTPSAGTLAAGATQALAFLADQAGSFTTSLSAPGASITGNPRSTTATLGQTFLLTFSVPSTATVNAAVSGSIQNTGTGSVAWSITPPAHVTVVPSSGTLAGGATQALSITIDQAGPYSLVLSAPTATITGNPQLITAAASVTTATLTGQSSAIVNSPHAARVTLNAPADRAYTVTPIRSNGGTGAATYTIAQGASYVDIDSIWGVVGSARTLDFTISPSLTRAGNPLSVDVVAGAAFTFPDGATLTTTGRNASVAAVSSLGTAWAYISPDMPPGQSLQVSGGTASIVGDNTVPTVDGSTPGSVEDAISTNGGAGWVIEVLDTTMAVATIIRTGVQYGAGQPAPRDKIQRAMVDMQDGDILEISPGAIWADATDGSGYLENGCLHIWKSCTVRGIAGRGRWRLTPPGVVALNFSGIVIRDPANTYSDVGDLTQANRNKTIVISDCDLDSWGTGASDSGVRIRANSAPSSWLDYHASVTLSNFKIGKPPFQPSASGIAGACENLILQNGHVYDTGGGIGAPAGNDHNLYVTARNLTMRGVRSSRTRSAEFPFNQGNTMDGHTAKLTFNNADIQGCVFDCGPEGDASILIQAKGGGNLKVRGCLLISGKHSQTATGAIVFEKESGNFGGWMFGLEGHSVDVQRNVFINHRPYVAGSDQRAMVFFRPNTSGNYLDQALITSCVIRDNIGMSTVPNSLWVPNAPSSWVDANWAANNSSEAYSIGEVFANEFERAMLTYRRRYGTLAATGGSMSTHRFYPPHGYLSRTDSVRGLG